MSSHISGIKSHFSKSKKVELSLGVMVVGGGGLAPDTPPPPPSPQTLTRKFLYILKPYTKLSLPKKKFDSTMPEEKI